MLRVDAHSSLERSIELGTTLTLMLTLTLTKGPTLCPEIGPLLAGGARGFALLVGPRS